MRASFHIGLVLLPALALGACRTVSEENTTKEVPTAAEVDVMTEAQFVQRCESVKAEQNGKYKAVIDKLLTCYAGTTDCRKAYKPIHEFKFAGAKQLPPCRK